MPEATAITYPLRMPELPGFREISWGSDSVVAVTESPFTYAQQVYEWPGQRWKCAIRLPAMRLELARRWLAFFGMLNGQSGTFYLSDSKFARRSAGDNLGDPELDGSHATGALVKSKGWTPNMQGVARPGDWLEIGGRLRRVTSLEPVASDADGKAHFTVWPYVTPNLAGAPITWLDPRGIFRLANVPDMTWDTNRLMSGIQFSCIEAL